MTSTNSSTTSSQSQTDDIAAQYRDAFLDLATRRATGTLNVCLLDGDEIHILFQQGAIADLDTAEAETILTRALLSTGAFTDRDIKKATKKSLKRGADTLGMQLFGLEQVDDEDVLEIVQEMLIDRACEAFAAELESFEFSEHDENQIVDGFNNEISRVCDLLFAGEDVFIEAMRRLDRWDLVMKHYSALLDIYYATPKGMHYYSEPEEYQSEISLLKEMDGIKDLSEVIAAVPITPFEVLQILLTLAHQGEIEPLNPIQLFQLGVEELEKKNFDKAKRIFLRAMRLGLDDFDIQFKLAVAYDSLQLNDEAISNYVEFGKKCLSQNRSRDAIRAYQRISELDPVNLEYQKQVISLLISDQRGNDAIAQGLAAAEALSCTGELRAALDILLDLREAELDAPELGKKIVELAEQCGDHELVKDELAKNPSQVDEVLDADKALEMYQRLFCEGNDSLEIRMKLVELHLQKGNRSNVLKHIDGLLGSPHERQLKQSDSLVWLHKTRVSVDPGHIKSSRWLVEYYLGNDKKREALLTMENAVQNLDEKLDARYVEELRKHLVEIDGENYSHRQRLVDFYRRCERYDDAGRELEALANLATERKDLGSASTYWSELLKISPYNLEALLKLGEIHEASGEKTEAADYYQTIVRMKLLRGRPEEGEDVYKKLEAMDAKSPRIAQKLGAAFLTHKEKARGIDYLCRAAELYLERRDVGSATDVLGVVLTEDPKNTKGLELKRELDRLQWLLDRDPDCAPPTAPAAGESDSQAFQPRAPIKKATVAGITARLKNLKQGDDEPQPAGGRQVVQKGLKGIAAKLLKKKSTPEPTPEPAPEASEKSAPSAVKPGTSAASEPADAGDAAAASKVPEKISKGAAPAKRKSVLGAASRLKALGSSKPASLPVAESTDSAEPAATESAPVAPQESAPTESATSTPAPGASKLGGSLVSQKLESLQSAAQAGTVKPAKKLGGSASKLAKLRALRNKTEPSNDSEEKEEELQA